MDCVLGYHLSPLSCGVAKFNTALAAELGVPMLSLFDPSASTARRPLLSIKLSEFNRAHARDLDRWLDERPATQSLRLFLHAFDDTALEHRLIENADIVYVGNKELAQRLRPLCPQVVEAWCPGVLFDALPFDGAEVSVFSFGMAHKIRGEHYRRLETLLLATGRSYCLYLSTALHEGTSVDASFGGAVKGIRSSFAGPVHFLGFLSDAAVAHYLKNTTFFAAFFPSGVRANNTSLHTAMTVGAAVITNLDDNSPDSYRHMDSLLDIHRLETLPLEPAVLGRLGERARTVAADMGWDRLCVRLLEAEEKTPPGQPAR